MATTSSAQACATESTPLLEKNRLDDRPPNTNGDGNEACIFQTRRVTVLQAEVENATKAAPSRHPRSALRK